jgi:hypothetical protein
MAKKTGAEDFGNCRASDPVGRDGRTAEFTFAARPYEGFMRLNADQVGAWTDGEAVWISRGMIRFLKNDDELALVLAHEMAHARIRAILPTCVRNRFFKRPLPPWRRCSRLVAEERLCC